MKWQIDKLHFFFIGLIALINRVKRAFVTSAHVLSTNQTSRVCQVIFLRLSMMKK